MELTLYKGRPHDCTGRLEKEVRTYDLLDKLGMEYWRTDHAFMKADTMEDCKVIDDCLGATVCKNLFLCNRQKTKFYLLLMPGGKPFHTKDLSSQLGCARLSFGPPEDMERLLGVTPGSATVLALQNDTAGEVTLVIDRAVLQAPRFGCHPCINTSSLAFSTQDLTEKLLPALGHVPILVDLPEDSDA